MIVYGKSTPSVLYQQWHILDHKFVLVNTAICIDPSRNPWEFGKEPTRRWLSRALDGETFEDADLVVLLRECAKNKDLFKGTAIHGDILKRGRPAPRCLDALVTMYAKCSELAKAQELFRTYESRDVVTWTALIAGYAQKGHSQDALRVYEQMQRNDISPNVVTFTCILKACGSGQAADIGEQVHEEIAKQGLLEDNIALGNALVDMYSKCGAIAKALQVLEELPACDVISWNALIAGLAEYGENEQALNCLDRMHQEGVSPDAVTFSCILKACGSTGAADKGKSFHDIISRQGLLGNNLVLGNALVSMYAKCGLLTKAREVLEGLPVRNIISWNALIGGYAQQGEAEQALSCLEGLKHDCLVPNAVTLACILKVCGTIGAMEKGEEIHEVITKQGLLENNVVLGTALMDMYAKCGALAKAWHVFEDLPIRNVISWSAVIEGYAQQCKCEHALKCLKQMQQEGLSPNEVTYASILRACASAGASDEGEKLHGQIVEEGLLGKGNMLGNALVDMYAKCSALAKARRVLEELGSQDTISWNALIAGCVQHGKGEQALNCFEQMKCEGLSPDTATFTCLLKACSSIGAVGRGAKLHEEISKQGLLGMDVVLGTALVHMYAKCGALVKARQVLEELPVRDAIAWNALVAGYAQKGEGAHVLSCIERMHREGVSADDVTIMCILRACGNTGIADKGEKTHDEIAKCGLLGKDTMVGNTLVDMYVKCGTLAKAQRVLEELPSRDVIGWNSLIAGYAQQGQGEQALKCLAQMQHEDISPDMATFTCALKACGTIGAVDKGESIHEEIFKQGLLGSNVVLGNALVDMYAKCGALAKARRVLEELPVWDVVSWNALFAGYAQQCKGLEALTSFQQMEHKGLSPDAITFSHVLSACGRSGLVENARTLFNDMITKYGIEPDIEHFTCMIDLFGRAGCLDHAVGVMEKLASPDVGVWSALMGACCKWGHVSGGKWAFEHV